MYKSPLYGRRTGQILLKPLTFYQSWQFFPKTSFAEFLSIFTVAGGLPAYLLSLDSNKNLAQNIREKIFRKTEFLHNEIEFILKEELREPKNYFSILRALSLGKTKFSEIINETGLEKNVLSKYLLILERLQLIEKEVPVTERQQEKSKKGLYKITDQFTRFWFQYVFPYRSYLEMARFDDVLREWQKTFPTLKAFNYEKVCQEILWNLSEKIFPLECVGRWWDKNNEIDVVGFNSPTKDIIFGEAKWSQRPLGTNIFNDLKEKSQNVDWNLGSRKDHFIIFSKSGFTPDLVQLAEIQKNLFLVQENRLVS